MNAPNHMIVLEWLLTIVAPCDAAEPWQLGSQDAATPMMQGIIDLHDDILFFLILIFVFVSRMLVRVLWHFYYEFHPFPQRIVHGTTIEIIRTLFPSIIPMFIAIPSFALLYSLLPLFGGFVEIAACVGDSSSSEGVGMLPLPTTTSSQVSSISSRGISWIDDYFNEEVSSVAPEASTDPAPTQDPLPQGAPEAPPQAPAPAGIPHDFPHPNFDPNLMVGGESLDTLYLNLLMENKKRVLPSPEKLFEIASSILEIKTLILHYMEYLDPGRGWVYQGARFIRNCRNQEFTLDTLAKVVRSLQSLGTESPYFRSFLSKRDRGGF